MFAFRRASYVIFRQSRQNLTIKSFTSVASKASRTHGELSLSAAIRSLTRAFTEGNIPEPELSAKYLVLHAWKGDSKSSLQDLDSAGANHVTLDREQQEVLEDLKLKRLQRLSVQHCVGTWDFHDITLRLTPPILVPRPETEELVEIVLKTIRELGKIETRILDIGCGSGAIAVSVLHSAPRELQCTAVALDISDVAVRLTQENADRIGVSRRLEVHHCSIESYPAPQIPFDIVVSNPPYIPTRDLIGLEPEVRLHEDTRALDGGDDGLAVANQILHRADKGELLRPGGHLFMELDASHPQMLARVVGRERSFPRLAMQQILTDFSGKERFVHIIYQGAS